MRSAMVLFISGLTFGCMDSVKQNDTDPNQTGTPSIVTHTEIFDSRPNTQCGNHLFAGNPANADQILCRKGYAVGYNFQKKLANWVAYHLTRNSVNADISVTENYQEDNDIPSGLRAKLTDYNNSDYHYGQLAHFSTVGFNVTARQESFLLSNTTPQQADFTNKGWATLNDYLQSCAIEKKELYVVTGPLFNSPNPQTIGDDIAVPEAYYQVILSPRFPPTGFAFKIPHRSMEDYELEDYVTSIDNIELMTGIDFFAAIEDSIEQRIEADSRPICQLPWTKIYSNTNSQSNTFSCGTKSFCSQMSNCQEARFYMNACRIRTLDRDNNGTPCESICR